ncbi:hypothetical protein PG997_008298 [Apiospora hydei]|uniref:Uncharacterized protein n=1 Tax=Apiospora hydei TaxID=1337664 RepID=A0ABR1WDE0_9PEZI
MFPPEAGRPMSQALVIGFTSTSYPLFLPNQSHQPPTPIPPTIADLPDPAVLWLVDAGERVAPQKTNLRDIWLDAAGDG